MSLLGLRDTSTTHLSTHKHVSVAMISLSRSFSSLIVVQALPIEPYTASQPARGLRSRLDGFQSLASAGIGDLHSLASSQGGSQALVLCTSGYHCHASELDGFQRLVFFIEVATKPSIVLSSSQGHFQRNFLVSAVSWISSPAWTTSRALRLRGFRAPLCALPGGLQAGGGLVIVCVRGVWSAPSPSPAG